MLQVNWTLMLMLMGWPKQFCHLNNTITNLVYFSTACILCSERFATVLYLHAHFRTFPGITCDHTTPTSSHKRSATAHCLIGTKSHSRSRATVAIVGGPSVTMVTRHQPAQHCSPADDRVRRSIFSSQHL